MFPVTGEEDCGNSKRLYEKSGEIPVTKRELFEKIGSVQQLAYARPVVYREGRSEWMNAIEVKCGDLFFHALTDKCLDLSDLSFKGMNLSFLSKPGLVGRNAYDTNGAEAQRSIMCGFFFTCGLESICAPHTYQGKEYPMHGRMRTTPAEHTGSDVIVDDDGTIRVVLSGEMREAELFGENMVLRRRIETVYGENRIVLTDEIENQSFRDEVLMLMYHCNIGYPFLDEGCRLYAPSSSVKGREAFSDGQIERWNVMDAPCDNAQEYVFLHRMHADADGNTKVLFVNPEKALGLSVSYNTNELPYFNEWKSTASGDYVVGLEPANAMAYNREWHDGQGLLETLAPFEKKTYRLTFAIHEGEDEIASVIKETERLASGAS